MYLFWEETEKASSLSAQYHRSWVFVDLFFLGEGPCESVLTSFVLLSSATLFVQVLLFVCLYPWMGSCLHPSHSTRHSKCLIYPPLVREC